MPKLLTIDDEDEFRGFIKTFFEMRNFEVYDAENGDLGLEIARSVQPDVALVDYKMPGKNGAEVMESLRTISPHTKVIIITASGGLGKVRGKLQEDGAFACFDKPISSIRDLADKVKEAIDS